MVPVLTHVPPCHIFSGEDMSSYWYQSWLMFLHGTCLVEKTCPPTGISLDSCSSMPHFKWRRHVLLLIPVLTLVPPCHMFSGEDMSPYWYQSWLMFLQATCLVEKTCHLTGTSLNAFSSIHATFLVEKTCSLNGTSLDSCSSMTHV